MTISSDRSPRIRERGSGERHKVDDATHHAPITLRIRAYPGGTLAISAKTEEEKHRAPFSPHPEGEGPGVRGEFPITDLPAHLQTHVMEIAGNKPLVPVVTVYTRRYAIEDHEDRFNVDANGYPTTSTCPATRRAGQRLGDA
jgi:hypothetical protein